MLEKQESQETPLYNSRIFDTYLKLVNKRYNYVNSSELLDYAGMRTYEVADEAHWFTQSQANRFQEKLVQLTGNRNIAREAGRFAGSPEGMGAIRQQTLGMFNLTLIFAKLGKVYDNVSRSTVYKSRKIKENRVEVTIAPRPGVKESPHQCENRIGMFESIVMECTNKLPVISHTECVFRGGSCCRYVISWDVPYSSMIGKVRNLTFLGTLLLFMVYNYFSPERFREMLVPLFVISSVLLFLLETARNFHKIKELKKGMAYLFDASDQLVEQLEINYNNALMTNEVGNAISVKTSTDDILDSVIRISRKRLDYDRGMILLADPEKNRLMFRTGFGIREDQMLFLEQLDFRISNSRSKGMFVVAFREQKPFLVNDVEDVAQDLSPKSYAFARRMKSKSFICCPIVCDGESIGVLVVDNQDSKRKLVQSDLSLLMGISSVIGISIRNAQLINTAEDRFNSMLKVMAASIDAMDPLTAGHSEKVTEYSVGICRELGLSVEDTAAVKVAASLHDYGKIGVPDDLLKKPGRLTREEYDVIKTHAVKTREILEKVNFTGAYKEIPAIASSHHEKMDGSGYPQGLSGEDIPLGARIIAVADFFEAITAIRHYRDPMPLGEAFSLLEKERGGHLDPEVVDAFILFFKKSNPDIYREDVLAGKVAN